MISRPLHFHACPVHNPAKLRSLLEESLQPAEASALTEHLSQCEWCQETLESLASQPACWEETRESLTELIVTNSCTEAPRAAPSASAGQHKMLLGWLASTDRADSLGRMGNYEILSVVGHGGMGVVLEAWDVALHRLVAIKAMHPHLAAIGVAKQRFVREARAAAAVVHPHVVPIHSVDADHQPPYLVMQLIGGETLQARIDRMGALGVEAALRIGHQIAQGLAAAHAQGLVHRDVKPANILLESGTDRALLTDFGVARALDDASSTVSGTIAGTPEYMSPEQTCGEAVDDRSDLFSLGSVMYAMLTGLPPFRAESSLRVLRCVNESNAKPVCEVEPQVPRWMGMICAQLHAKDPESRPANAQAIAELLQHCLAHVREPHRIPLPASLPTSWYLNRPTTWTLSTVMSLVLVTLLGGLLGLAFHQMVLEPTLFQAHDLTVENRSASKTSTGTDTANPSDNTSQSSEALRERWHAWDAWDGLLEPIEDTIDKLKAP